MKSSALQQLLASRQQCFDIREVKRKKLNDVWLGGITTIHVLDEEFGDVYLIRLQRTNLGINAQCFLNNVPSYQADYLGSGQKPLREIIDAMAGAPFMDGIDTIQHAN